MKNSFSEGHTRTNLNIIILGLGLMPFFSRFARMDRLDGPAGLASLSLAAIVKLVTNQ